MDSSLFAGAYVTADDSPTSGPGYGAANATCEPGYRVLTGGAAPAGTKTPGVNQGHNSVSGPLDYRHWPVTGYQYSGVTLRALALCVPASTASVTFTQTPAALSTASSGTITFAVNGRRGETFVDRCYLDGDERGCSSGSPVSYGPLIDGSHSLG